MATQLETKGSSEIPLFGTWLKDFLRHHRSDVVVDIGSDPRLKLTLDISNYSGIVHSVNFPKDHIRMSSWHEMHQDMGVKNIQLTSGDALHLSKIVPHADVIIVKNVLLDGNKGEDTTLMWQHRRGEKECTDEEWVALLERFDQAKVDGFAEFLKVAKPGYIIRFARTDEEDSFFKMLTEKLGVDPAKIDKQQFLYDDKDKESWEAYIIDNT